MKYGDLNLGQIEAVVNKLGGMDGVNKFLRGELKIEPKWIEKNGIIYFSVTSDGTTGKGWITRLERKGFNLDKTAKDLLCSKNFKPTNGITYEIAVLKGKLFNSNDRIMTKIRQEAKNRKFITPNAEIACLIREKFSDEELEAMGLYWIVTMHELMKDSNGDFRILDITRCDKNSLSTIYNDPDDRWLSDSGFAFVVRKLRTHSF